jgi:hypothetical protein
MQKSVKDLPTKVKTASATVDNVGIKVGPSSYRYREASAGHEDGDERKVPEASVRPTSEGSDEGK